MIGTGCAAYFEGIMMVFWQRPYDIGDRIATSYVRTICVVTFLVSQEVCLTLQLLFVS